MRTNSVTLRQIIFMKQFLIFGAISLLAFSCSDNEKKILSVEKKSVMKEAVPVAANAKLNIGIAGMSCEHACGGAIRMALKETEAVDRVSFNGFDAGNAYNQATITYDNSKISEAKIVSIIEELNDHQFTTERSAQTADKNP